MSPVIFAFGDKFHRFLPGPVAWFATIVNLLFEPRAKYLLKIFFLLFIFSMFEILVQIF